METSKKPKTAKHDDTQEDLKQVVKEESVTSSFSLQVAKHVIQQHLSKETSVICSPVSIDAILNILAVGAENSTLDQLLKLLGHADFQGLKNAACKLSAVLKSSNDDDNGPKISFVNGLWLDHRFSLKPGFQKVLRDVHKAEARAVDFNQADQVVEEANSWASQETKGMIEEFLSKGDITSTTILFLANALYFKGTWYRAFGKVDTEIGDFNLLSGDKIRVPLMYQYHKFFEYGTFDECKVLKMPYKIGKSSDDETPMKTFSMYVFLPHENDGLPNLVEKIKFDANLFKDKFKLNSVKIAKLVIPKFKFECNFGLKEPMKQLGLTLPFDEFCKDFSGMTDIIYPIYVDDMSQMCIVEVNEEGTVASAFTRGRMPTGGMMRMPPPITFVADHPFMFAIREDVSEALLFIGTCLSPK
ncbi:serpin-ZX-like [Silene latifolia]|uniref:serpin-ZX-like n=1 Tax=Silene latifolia TaxID=37657 RepID=UPI003D77BCE0